MLSLFLDIRSFFVQNLTPAELLCIPIIDEGLIWR